MPRRSHASGGRFLKNARVAARTARNSSMRPAHDRWFTPARHRDVLIITPPDCPERHQNVTYPSLLVFVVSVLWNSRAGIRSGYTLDVRSDGPTAISKSPS